MSVIKSVGILSWAKIQALFGIIIGLAYGCIMTFVGSAISAATGLPKAAEFGYLSLVIFPVLWAVAGFVCGAVTAFLYNIFSSYIGGIEITLSDN